MGGIVRGALLLGFGVETRYPYYVKIHMFDHVPEY